MGFHKLFLGWPQTVILLIPALEVARITGKSYLKQLVLFCFFFFSFSLTMYATVLSMKTLTSIHISLPTSETYIP
jgi:hypothetical protein